MSLVHRLLGMKKVLNFWITPFRAGTWRRFGYAIAALPVGLLCLVLALIGRADTAAGYQRRLAGWVADDRPSPTRLNVVVCSLAGIAIGALSWVLVQDLAFLIFINLAYPLRAYVSLIGNPANFLPWQGWNLLLSIRVHAASGPDPWGNTYATSWGGPTLAGAWVVHAGLALVTVYPLLAWPVRGLARLQAGVTRLTLSDAPILTEARSTR
jgi:hypothetical protein